MARKMSNYRGNIASILQSDFATYHQREDNSKRARKIAQAVGKSGNWPAISDLQVRYRLNETEAKKLLAAAKRQLHKLQKDAKALEAARAERRAMLAPVEPPAPPSPKQPATFPPSAPQPVVPTPAQLNLNQVLAGIRDKYGDEIRKRGEQTTIPEGFVYLVTHPLFGGWVKAGMTIDFEVRLGVYNVSDPLSRFEYAAVKWVPNRRQAETKLLARLAAEAGTDEAGEWFELPVEAALQVFEAL